MPKRKKIDKSTSRPRRRAWKKVQPPKSFRRSKQSAPSQNTPVADPNRNEKTSLQDQIPEIESANDTKQNLTQPAREKLRTIADNDMVIEAENILDALCKTLDKIDTRKLPPVRAFEVEDDSLLIEWIFPHHRVGFNIEPDKQESGWFLVSDKSAQSINAWGYLPDENIEWLMAWLLEPITDYYS